MNKAVRQKVEQTPRSHTYRDKHQPFVKTFRKRSQLNDGATPTSHRFAKQSYLQPEDRRQIQQVLPLSHRKNAENKSTQRKSASKGKQKPVNKISLNSPAYHQQSLAATIAETAKVSQIFGRPVNDDPKQALQALYAANEQYQALLCSWQKQQLYDENDRLVYKLVQYFLTNIEHVYEKSLSQLANFMGLYQQMFTQLEFQQKQAQYIAQSEATMAILQHRLAESMNKAQCATMILSNLSQNHFDLENYARTLPIFPEEVRLQLFQDLREKQSQFKIPPIQINSKTYQDSQLSGQIIDSRVLHSSKNLPMQSRVMINTKQSPNHLVLMSQRNSDTHSLISDCNSINLMHESAQPGDPLQV